MLNRLSVNNFALIENAELDLNNGFTVITGETVLESQFFLEP